LAPAPSRSANRSELRALWRKEWQSELRSRNGLLAATLFGFLAVVALTMPASTERLTPAVASAQLAVVVLFSVMIAVPRLFLTEDEQGTLDTLRLWADPGAIFLAKALMGMVLCIGQALLMGGAFFILTNATFFILTNATVTQPFIALAGLVAYGAALAATVSMASALVPGAQNRWLIALVISLPLCLPVVVPLCLPVVVFGTGVMAAALGSQKETSGWLTVGVLLVTAVATLVLGAVSTRAIWRLR